MQPGKDTFDLKPRIMKNSFTQKKSHEINLYFFSSYLFLLEPDLCIILLDLCYFSFLKGSCELQVQTVEEAGYAQYPRNSTRARRFAVTN